MRRLLWVAIVCGAGAAWADAIDVKIKVSALLGQGDPSVQVLVLEPVAGLKLKLKRSDGKEIELKGSAKPGQTRVFDLPQAEGKFSYTGDLFVNLPNGTTQSMAMQFDTEVRGPLHMKCEKGDLDVERRKIKFSIDRPGDHAVVRVLMDTGRIAFDGQVPFNGAPANTPLEVTWPETPGRVLKISIQAYDTAKFFTGLEIFPWQIDIPHEEVNFDSGKWDVRGGEVDKLDKSYALISEAVNKYGRLAEIKLYVAGHTDTVGKNEANRTLSLNRARSIGAFLRKRGLTIPIFFEGFGEESLAVGTGDEEAEPKNRRAEYIIAVESPTIEPAPFAPKWRKL